ncbi:Vps62-related protein (plasmid) [Pseudoalteromonas sp. T1lg65]|uniref:Vps62-related protein n=1 Tax=Pseudoalteromonas sp. T1lg65 TaxID=2077101 RepID=UPI003F7A6497
MNKIEIARVKTFKLAWDDQKSGAGMNGAFYNPTDIPVGFYAIGSYGQGNYDAPNGSVVVVKQLDDGALTHPQDYSLMYDDKKSGARLNGSFWLPIPQDGYVAMGIVCVEGYEKPSTDMVVCLRKDLVTKGSAGSPIWIDSHSGATMDGGFWNIDVEAGSINTGTFAGTQTHVSTGAKPLFGINNNVA